MPRCRERSSSRRAKLGDCGRGIRGTLRCALKKKARIGQSASRAAGARSVAFTATLSIGSGLDHMMNTSASLAAVDGGSTEIRTDGGSFTHRMDRGDVEVSLVACRRLAVGLARRKSSPILYALTGQTAGGALVLLSLGVLRAGVWKTSAAGANRVFFRSQIAQLEKRRFFARLRLALAGIVAGFFVWLGVHLMFFGWFEFSYRPAGCRAT